MTVDEAASNLRALIRTTEKHLAAWQADESAPPRFIAALQGERDAYRAAVDNPALLAQYRATFEATDAVNRDPAALAQVRAYLARPAGRYGSQP